MLTKKTDISKHIFVPKHSKLSEKDKNSLLNQLGVPIEALPKIRLTDSAIDSLKLKPGDIVKILRPSPTAGEAVFYRVVVNV